MTNVQLMSHKRFETAEELLDALDPAKGALWEATRQSVYVDRGWVFRGMWDAKYKLRPTAFRDGAFKPFDFPAITSAADQRAQEEESLVTFCTEADHLGFQIPTDRPELRDARAAPARNNPFEFPPLMKLHMYALAQHYGVPTRLLDWSRKALVAAYFAVEEVTRLEVHVADDHECAIWALDEGFLQALIKKDVWETTQAREVGKPVPDRATMIVPVTAPLASNAHLAAQGGVFTLVQPLKADLHPIPDLDEVITSLRQEDLPEHFKYSAPLLLKYSFPVNVARHLLRLLALKGIHAATVFPGLHSIMDIFREQKHHHRIPAPPLVAGK